jgi:aspartyl-tRNA(Asn)/glutamyl-tRNA(Gln) amidotransferase subunit A
MPLDFSLDHMGPLTRMPEDAALVMNAIAGCDPRDDTSSRHPVPDYGRGRSSLEGLRIGLPENFYSDRIAPAVEAAFNAAVARAEAAGARMVPIRVPDPVEINVISRVILLAEASALLEPYLHRRGDFGADVIALLDQGRLIAATDYISAFAACTSAKSRNCGSAATAFSPQPRPFWPRASGKRTSRSTGSRRMSGWPRRACSAPSTFWGCLRHQPLCLSAVYRSDCRLSGGLLPRRRYWRWPRD